MKALLLTFIFILTLGCERVTTKDGTIPAEYMAIAQKYAGEYHGQFEGQNGTMTLALEGNRPVLSFRSSDGSTDLLGLGCNSTIGAIAAINPEKHNDVVRVDSAEFAITSGSADCPLLEKNLLLDFKHDGDLPVKFEINVLSRYEQDWQTFCYPDGSGGQHCHQEPWNIPVYYSGTFKR
jgi:hypothetical protein